MGLLKALLVLCAPPTPPTYPQTLLDMLQEQQDQAQEAVLRLQQQQQSRLPGAAAAASTAHNPHHPPPEPEIPKLGSIMRWVRLADLAGTEATAARLLASVLRVAGGPQPGSKATAPEGSGPTGARAGAGGAAGGAVVPAQGHADRNAGYSPQEPTACTLPGTALPVRRFPPWRPPPPPDGEQEPQQPQQEEEEGKDGANGEQAGGECGGASAQSTPAGKRYGPYAGKFAVVPLPPEYAGTNANGSTAAALAPTATAPTTNGNGNGNGNGGTATTLLPNLARDLTMYCTEPGTIRFEAGRRATRVEVPFVPGAFVLAGALSRDECAQIVACAEEMGYAVDPVRAWWDGL